MRRASREDRVCYFAQCGNTGRIKIGVTCELTQRLYWLRTMVTYRLKLLGYVHEAAWPEAVLHERFSEHRYEGEWFEPHADILAFIAEHSEGLEPPS